MQCMARAAQCRGQWGSAVRSVKVGVRPLEGMQGKSYKAASEGAFPVCRISLLGPLLALAIQIRAAQIFGGHGNSEFDFGVEGKEPGLGEPG